MQTNRIDLFSVENTIQIAECKTYIPAYDFHFYPLFITSGYIADNHLSCIARIGAIADYGSLYTELKELGCVLINNPQQHSLAASLHEWYPLISNLTPKSRTFVSFPEWGLVQQDFIFPVFIKGDRQTSGHNPALSIAYNENDFERIRKAYAEDSILHWQPVVIREYVPLKKSGKKLAGQMQISFEFRTFWWKKQLVGTGHYWSQFAAYDWSSQQRDAAISVAAEAAQRIDVPFLVIDMALTAEGQWIVIECNDAQESGYCGVDRVKLWRNIIELESSGID